MMPLLTGKDYPPEVLPCSCCGTAIGVNSAAANNGRRCLTCVDDRATRALFGGPHHDPTVCKQDRQTIIDLTARGFAAENIGKVVLPSGRAVVWEPGG